MSGGMNFLAMAKKGAAVVETPEERKLRLQAEAKAKTDEIARALDTMATKLCNAVESACRDVGGGNVTGNYWRDLQFTIPGSYTTNQVMAAKSKWITLYDNAGTKKSLNVHVLGPSRKHTGDRKWPQANFIRNRSGRPGRYNVHVNVRD